MNAHKEIGDKLHAIFLWIRDNKDAIKNAGYAAKFTVIDLNADRSEGMIESCGACTIKEAAAMSEADIISMFYASGRDCLVDFMDEYMSELSERLDEEYEDMARDDEEAIDYPGIENEGLFS